MGASPSRMTPASARPSPRFSICSTGAKVVLMAHFGRPKGKPVPKYSLQPVAERLAEILEHRCSSARSASAKPSSTASMLSLPGDVLLLENCAFTPRKRRTTRVFAKRSLGWATSTSTTPSAPRTAPTLPPRAWPPTSSEAASGLLMEKELKYLQGELADPAKPVRGDPWRLEGFRQDRRHQGAHGKGRHLPYRRRDGVHVLQGAGHRHRQQPRRKRQDRSRHELLELAKKRA